MIKFRSRLLQNWSSTSWNTFFCNKVIFFNYVYKKFLWVSVFWGNINIFMQPLFHHFDSFLRFEYYLHNHFLFCFQLFGWIILSLEHKNCNYLLQNKETIGLTYQKYAKFLSRFEQEGVFKLKISRNHCQSFFFINAINEDCLNPIHMQKMLFSCHNSY